MTQKTSAKKPVTEDPRFAQAVQNYEAGLRALQERKFEKAKTLLQKSYSGASKELADRVNIVSLTFGLRADLFCFLRRASPLL